MGGASPAAAIQDAFSATPLPDHRRWPRTDDATGSGCEPRGSAALRAQECGGTDAPGQRTRTGVPKSPVIPRNSTVPVYGCVRCVVMVVIIMVSPPFGLVLNGARAHYPHQECLRKHFHGFLPELLPTTAERPGVVMTPGRSWE